jgi:hypothetical protein
MINNVKLVKKMPKLPLLNDEYILILTAQKMIGYTIFQSVFGTVNDTIDAIIRLSNQLIISKHNLTGLLCQSCLINLIVLR